MDLHAALKPARDTAYAYASAARKLSRRTDAWVEALAMARRAGAPPGMLREQIHEGAAAARVPLGSVPPEVWRAAGLDPTDSGD